MCVYILCFRIIYVCYKCQTLTIIERQVVDFFLLFYINIVKILKRKNISKHQQPHENIDKQLFQNYYYFVCHALAMAEEQATTKQDRIKK